MAESPHYRELLQLLNEFEVEYLIVGGFAVMKQAAKAEIDANSVGESLDGSEGRGELELANCTLR